MWTASHLKRLVYLVHRWIGVAACLLMAMWVASGVVMLFVGYPKLLPHERLASLPALEPSTCCVPVETALSSSRAPSAVKQIALTSIAGHPHYRIREERGDLYVVDAVTGARRPSVDAARALASASAFVGGAHGHVDGRTMDDRWTHAGALDPHRPLYKVWMDDARSTLVYVSSTTGEVVMDVPAVQRRWNYVGAWLHWLYMFRDGARDPVWTWLVIVLSAIGTLGAITGALVGLWRWRFSGHYRSGAKTPYKRVSMRWHHITGLLFGAVLVTWIFSGLMSMNPLGVFDAQGERPDAARYRGGEPGAVRLDVTTAQALRLLHEAGFTPSEMEWRVLAGRPYLLARNAGASSRLIVPDEHRVAVVDRWSDDRLTAAAARLMRTPLVSAEPLHAYDAYYYRRQEASMYAAAERPLPALLVRYADAGSTAIYLDPTTGDVALGLDRAQRTGRWLFNFLHSWDLPTFLRHAGAREVVLLLLSIGALLIAVTGVIIGWRRVTMLRGSRQSLAAIPPVSHGVGP